MADSKNTKAKNELLSLSDKELYKRLDEVAAEYEKELSRGKLAQVSPRELRRELARLQTEKVRRSNLVTNNA